MRLWICLLLLLATLATVPARAHSDPEKHEALKHESVERLEHYLEHEILHRLRAQAVGAGLSGDAPENRVGEKLLSAVHEEVVLALRALGPPTVADKSLALVKGAIKRFNPVALGRWVIQAARTHGTTLAVAYGVSEVVEQVGVLLTFKYPELAFLLPIYLTHASDVVVIGAFFTVPKIKGALSRWKRHGGWWKGARGYYEHLIAQRRALPIDWSIVIETPQFEDVKFAVIEEGRMARKLSRSLRIAFDARKLAQRQATPTLGLWEIEKIAKDSGIAVYAYKPFKADPRMYLRLVLREIMAHENARAKLGLAVKKSVKAVEIGKPKYVVAGPDQLAEQWRWYFRQRLAFVKEAAAAQTVGILPGQRKIFRELSKHLDGDKGLARLAATRYSDPAPVDWARVSDALADVEALFREIEGQLLPVRACQSLLTSK